MQNAPAPDIFVPDGTELSAALARSTHLGIGAHPDDLEIIAISGILAGRASSEHWFSGVVVCDGAGSPRSGPYADFSDEAMAACRREEQRKAASLGAYSAVLQLGYSSESVKSDNSQGLVEDLAHILQQAQPRVLYLHNLADQHATHRALARACITALRQLPPDQRPAAVYGVEVWGSLDWLPAPYRAALAIDDPDGLQAQLLQCHDSQVSGGKRYDEAIIARQRANATLSASHDTDELSASLLAMDLTPLLENPELSPQAFLAQCLDAFATSLQN